MRQLKDFLRRRPTPGVAERGAPRGSLKLVVALVAVAALVVIPASLENAGDPDTAVASWQYATAGATSGPVKVTVSGKWDWGPAPGAGGAGEAQSCWSGNNPQKPATGFDDVNGHWAVGIAVSWNNVQTGDTPATLTGKAIDGTPVTLHLPQEIGLTTNPLVAASNEFLDPNYCAGTTAANPYPSGSYVATETYDSYADFQADTNGGQICVNAYDVHQPTSDEENTTKNGDNTLHNNHYDLTPGVDCALATNNNPTGVATQLSQSTITVGQSVSDSATLSGVTANAGGSVAYTVYPGNQCTNGGTSEGTVTVTNGTVPNSNSYTPPNAGTYSWQAVYSGDAANNGSTSVCGTETVTVTAATPTITTTLSTSSTPPNQPVHDSAQLKNAFGTPTGTVVYSVYGSTADCDAETNSVFSSTVTLAGGSIPNSTNFTPTAGGTYYWRADYSGDANNAPAQSACSDEILTVVANNLQILITPETVTNPVGNAHTFTVTVNQSVAGAGFTPVSGATVSSSVTNANGATGTITGGTCTAGGTTNASGQCTIIVNSNHTGQVTVHASTTATVNGQQFTRALGDNLAGDGTPAVKTFVDAQIAISPLTPTNPINTPHTFTVTLQADAGDGSGFQPVQGATVTPSATNAGGATGTITGGTCTAGGTTNASGQCTIIVNSPTAGTVKVSATSNVSVGGISLTRTTGDSISGDSAAAVKTYVDAEIAISPLTSTNPVGVAHTFTVTVQANNGDGSGFHPVSGLKVTPTLTPGNGANPTLDPSSTCPAGTSAAGTCTIVVNSSTTGSIGIQASANVPVGGLTLTRTTGDGISGDSQSATKIYAAADGRISITPSSSTNETGSAHTFTVTTLESLNGGAFGPASGITVTPTLTYANGATSQPATGTCTTGATGADGTCTIVVNSSTPGQVTIHASASFNVNVSGTNVSFTRSTGDNVSGDGSDATKTFVDSFITISPASATNPLNATHVLTIQVFTNSGDGNGYVAAPNGTPVTVATLAGSVGSFINGVSTCSIANGVCTVSTVSSTAGTDTYQATTTLSVKGISMTRTTGVSAPGHANSANATKTWVGQPPSGGGGGGGTPSISIIKNPKSQSITKGGTATFTITVTNTGTTTLANVNVADSLAPNCAKTSSDNSGFSVMQPGASVSYTCTLAGVEADFTNSATATGTAPTGATVQATDTAPVTVTAPQTPPATPVVKPAAKKKTVKAAVKPKISISKDPKLQTLTATIVKTSAGSTSKYGTASFTIKVTNSGNVKLTHVTVTDALSPDCSRKNLGTLLPSASSSYTCTLTNVKRAFTNVAVASGKPPTGPRVSAQDHAVVKVNFKTTSTKPAKFTG